MAHLFKKNIVKEKLENFEIPNFEEKLEIVKKWNKYYHNGTLKNDKEISVAPDWTKDFLWNILDYSWKSEEEHTYAVEYTVLWQRPDFVLGYFDKEENLVVWELKDAKTSLDAPQKREWSITPVQQAFKYKWWLRNTAFVIVSNFYETRLYNDNHLDFEVWTLDDLVDSKNKYENFRKFYYLLCKTNLISKRWDSNTKNLLWAIRTKEKEITKQFYKEYSVLRKELFKDIVVNNSTNNKKINLDLVLTKTQKIIDRIIFIHFCEDLWLLPNWRLEEKVLKAESLGFAPWDMIKKFFEFVDIWHEDLENIGGYNWGLFKEDTELNNLKVWDEICKKFVKLWDYDFENDLSVNILWHIFEQSISDIEELKDKINKKEEVTLSKRKKDWVFYTPEYIVDYIVKNSVGKKIDDWEEELMKKHKLKEDITDKNYEKRALLVYEELQTKVQNIKVIDPACGSWAFLVKVFDYLLDKNKEIANKIQDLSWSNAMNMFQTEAYFRDILKNNIYWVDLNEESVEISKLSLWLKTASKGKKLANLDGNIKCGNSLIDDKEIAWDKAFVWETEFKDIFDDGGFDVVVGNPPYVVVNKNDDISKLYNWNEDLYLMFFEKVLTKLIKKNWYFWFITPRFFLVNKTNDTFRKFLLNDVNLVELVETSPFEDANTECVISIINFNKNTKTVKISNDIEWNIIFNNDIEKEIFKSNNDYLINTSITSEKYNLNQKIEQDSIILSNIIKSKRWMEIWKPLLRENKMGIKSLIWQDINKYSFLFENTFILENHKEYLRLEEFFKWEKIYLRRVAKELIAYIWNDFAYNKNIYWLEIKDNNFWIKYIISLLNSSLLTYYYKSKFSTKKWDLFPEIQSYLYNQLPIKNIPLLEQTPFIEKANFMLDKNKELWEKINKFLNRLNSSFQIDKLTNKLKSFYELEFSEFVKELKKKKVSMSLVEQDEWEEYFDSYKSVIVELKSEIDKCDDEIDDMVFELYGLNKEEREIVLGSN